MKLTNSNGFFTKEITEDTKNSPEFISLKVTLRDWAHVIVLDLE